MNYDTHKAFPTLPDLLFVLLWKLHAIADEVLDHFTLDRLMCTNCGDVVSMSLCPRPSH